MRESLKLGIKCIIRKWYLYIPLLLLKILFDFAEDLLFSVIKKVSVGFELVKFLENYGLILSWIIIPATIIGLLIKDYVKEYSRYSTFAEAANTFRKYYEILNTLASQSKLDMNSKLVKEAISLNNECTRLYNKYKKELGLEYEATELVWDNCRGKPLEEEDAFFGKLQKIIYRFEELKDRES